MNNNYQLIDPAVLMDAAGEDTEAFLQLLEVFLRIVPEMAQRLDHAVQAGVHADLAREAHALKSCLALVGARTARARVEAIERDARREGVAAANDAYLELRCDLDAIVAEARACHAAAAGARA